jgi:hypothetical protein
MRGLKGRMLLKSSYHCGCVALEKTAIRNLSAFCRPNVFLRKRRTAAAGRR